MFQTEKINGEWRDTDCSEQIQQSVKYTNYQLDGLHPDTTYKIELRAHNAIGDSSPAQIRVKTARGEHQQYYTYNTYKSTSDVCVNCSNIYVFIFILITKYLF